MPDYLIIDTTSGAKLTDGNRRRVNNAATENEAIAVVMLDQGFAASQEFTVFRISQGVKIVTKQERTVFELETDGLTARATYTEAQLVALKAARGGWR